MCQYVRTVQHTELKRTILRCGYGDTFRTGRFVMCVRGMAIEYAIPPFLEKATYKGIVE